MPTTPEAQRAQRTSTLIDNLRMLEERDFSKFMGSGVLMTLTDLDGKSLHEHGVSSTTFCLAGEDMEAIKPSIISSLKESLRLRQLRLQMEMRDITCVLEE